MNKGGGGGIINCGIKISSFDYFKNGYFVKELKKVRCY